MKPEIQGRELGLKGPDDDTAVAEGFRRRSSERQKVVRVFAGPCGRSV